MKKLMICFYLFFILKGFVSAQDKFCFSAISKKVEISEELLKAISSVESNGDNSAININSTSIDICHMQINSFWFNKFKPDQLLSDPCYCTFAGGLILKNCFERYGYNWNGLACYNSGVSFDQASVTRRDKHKLIEYLFKVKIQMSR